MNPDNNEINLAGSQADLTRNTSSSPLNRGLPRVSVLYSKFQPCNELPWIIKFLIKAKLAKNEKQAERLILLLILVLILAAIVLFALSFKEPAVNI